ncbi:LysM peptidoglycan-binding domain-containing protein [Streptococcus sp. SM5]|uniref:aggregation-promoting factor n=1 Tax=Streptococcus sp. SM5 TaxID=2898232 RepID=UPI0022B7BD82|nr:LysM peptidoglycan-binding domain-containing protein [Streptococcus sp. SM5]
MKSNIRTKFAGLAVVLAFLAPSLTFAQETKTYVVKPGDTLSEIAETHNTTVEKLAKLNNIKNIHLIYVDQVLVIDGEAPVVAATPATTKPAAPATTEASATTEAVAATEAPAPAATTAAPAVEETPAPAAATPAPAVEESAPAATVSGSEAEAKEWIAQKESGGSYTATNGRYIGRYQLTDSYLNGDYSAENQERVADAYVAGRYGSWTAAKNFWLNNGWY